MTVAIADQLRTGFAQLKSVGRASEWWDYKIAPLMAVLYGTVVVQGASVASVWPACLALLLAMAACALYVSVINDATDRPSDLAAGKHNRLAGKPRWYVASAIAGPVVAGLVFAVLWRDDATLLIAYLGAWIAFSLYSVPPIRLKIRGGFGVIADASGAHLFPTLAAALLGFRATGTPVDPVWLAATGIWAFAAGLRGILWHQLSDVENDRRANIETFVVRRSPRVAVLLVRYGTFPAEMLALAVMLWKMQGAAPLVCLALYAGFVTVRARMWGQRLVIVEPCARQVVLGHEYYSFLMPVGILVLSASRFPSDLLVLVAHLILFRGPALMVGRQFHRLARGPRKAPRAVAAAPPEGDARVAAIEADAREAIEAGDLVRADDMLSMAQAIRDADADRLASSASETGAQRGRLSLTRQRYDEAARHFACAAARAPGDRNGKRLEYLDEEAKALFRQSVERGDDAAGEAAVERYRRLLVHRPRDRAPLDWAASQENLGNALRILGERGTGGARLHEAVAAYRAALEERTRECAPLPWATTQNNLASALRTLGEREASPALLTEAVAACRAALEERTRERVPLQWAATQTLLGDVLRALSQRETGTACLEEAVLAYRDALREVARERAPLQWAALQENLGNALRTLGERGTGGARLREAVAAYRAALEERTRARVPLPWAATQNNLGSALRILGEREASADLLAEAVVACRAALQERTRERVPLQWAATQNILGNALRALGERESGTARLDEAVAVFESCLEVAQRIWTPAQVDDLRARRDRVRAERIRREPASVMAQAATNC